jgi:AmiR/NasT family two-component response regulator
VLVLTDNGGKGYEDRAAEIGVKGFIYRPLDEDKLRASLKRLL